MSSIATSELVAPVPTPDAQPADARRLRDDVRRILELIRPERLRYTLGLLSLALVNFADALAPLFLAVAVDVTAATVTDMSVSTPPLLAAIGLDASAFGIVGAALVFLGLHLTANAARYPMLMNVAVPSHRIGQRVRNALVGHLLRLPQPFYDRAKSGDLMSRGTADLNAVRMMLGPGVLVGSDTLMLLTFVFGVLMSMSWSLTLIVLIPLPLIGYLTNRLSHMEYDRFEDVQEDIASLTERARESYAGIRIIQGYAREGFYRGRWQDHSEDHYRKNLRLARVRALFDPTLDLMFGASTVLVLIFGGLRVVDGSVSVGTFVAFLFLVGYLAGPMIGFGWAVSLFQRGRASLRRIDRLLQEEVTIDDPENPVPLPDDAPCEITVRDLSFAYAGPREAEEEHERSSPSDTAPRATSEHEPSDDTEGTARAEASDEPADTGDERDGPIPALHDVSFELPRGKLLGIIGPVGSGKSTLVHILARLYDPPPGTVEIDGVDIRERSLSDLRRAIVVAPQDTFLFSDTVARNITMPLDAEAQIDAEPEHFARLACLHEDLEELSDGYETMLGERGVNLSGGQRQRLAIARAIAADPRVLVLDDCLSAVDARTEEAILSNLREVFAGRSGIVVSHRVVAVQDCDEILVLRGGRVVERGTHDELIAGAADVDDAETGAGYYAEIAMAQTHDPDAVGSPDGDTTQQTEAK